MKVESLKKLNLPDCPGIYFFKRGKSVLYIGRATSLRDRVRSYFLTNLIDTRGFRIVDMVAKSSSLSVEKTGSVLEAIIREAILIKRHQPAYNVDEKDDKTFNNVVITNEKYPQIFTVRGRELSLINSKLNDKYKYIFGPFPNAGALQGALKFIRQVFPYRDPKCVPCEIQKKKGRDCRPCFNRHIGLCPGVCTGEISKEDYAQTIRNIKNLFEGKMERVVKDLEVEMNNLAAKELFEMAADVKKKLFALTHIRDVAMIKANGKYGQNLSFSTPTKDGTSFRVEAYDVAHFSGKNARGVMVVSVDGNFEKGEYRVFKIKTAVEGDDVGSLREILTRRMAHAEWIYPDLMVIDGGTLQLNAAVSVVKKLAPKIKIVSVVKDERHRAKELAGDVNDFKHLKNSIISINAEAHRFAVNRFRKISRRNFV